MWGSNSCTLRSRPELKSYIHPTEPSTGPWEKHLFNSPQTSRPYSHLSHQCLSWAGDKPASGAARGSPLSRQKKNLHFGHLSQLGCLPAGVRVHVQTSGTLAYRPTLTRARLCVHTSSPPSRANQSTGVAGLARPNLLET